MSRRLTGVFAASIAMASVTGSAWAVYPSIIDFEQDADSYNPTSRDMLNDPNLDGTPPTFPSPPADNFLRDIRSGYAGVIEEISSNHNLGPDGFAPAAPTGTHLGMMNFEGADAAYGHPMPGATLPAGNLQWSFQTDIYTDPAIPHVNNGLPTFWWTNSLQDHNDQYLTEQGFQIYAGSHQGRPSTGNPAPYWSFTVGGYFNPNDPEKDELGIIPVGQWVTMETLFDFNDPSGKIYGIQRLWSKDHTILYGEDRNIVYNAINYPGSPPNGVGDVKGPGYTWFVYPNLGVSALFVDNLGIGPAITQVVPPASEKYWDLNGVVTGSGGPSPSGDWNGVSPNFNSDSAGGTGTLSGVTNSSDTVVFSAGSDATGSYTVTVTGGQLAAQVRIEEGDVTFNGGSIATSAIDVASGASAVVNSLLTGGANSGLVKSGAGALTLNFTNYTGDTNVTGGTLTAASGVDAGGTLSIADGAKVIVPDAAPAGYDPNNAVYPSGNNNSVTVVTALTMTGSAQLDLNNSDMVVDHGGSSPLADIRDLLASGFNGGGWDGAGIISTTAFNLDPSVFGLGYGENADLPTPYGTELGGGLFSDQDPDATSVLIKFTWVGDLNLDGLVDFQDLSVFNTNYDNGATSGRLWTEGDFNYDGFIDFQDLSLFNTNYDPNKPSLPEPGGLAVLAGACFMGILRRQRRGKKI